MKKEGRDFQRTVLWVIFAMSLLFLVSVLSMAAFVPAYLVLSGPPDLPAAAYLGQAVYQGLLGGCVGVLAYGAAVARLGAGRAALFPSFVPALATLLAVPVLDQVPDALQAAGIVLSSLGLLTALDLFGRRSRVEVAGETA